ncbi:MAG: site-specific integrase [Dehalococcoidales bacterium]|nr:site-specific integrase [Dehalococcoidales bacterium]
MTGRLIKRKGSSTWTAVLQHPLDSNGRRKQQWINLKTSSIRKAKDRLSELVHQMETGTLPKPSKTTVGQFLDRWLNEYARPNLAPRTTEGYEHMIRKYIVPNLGTIYLTALKPEHLLKYYSDLRATGLSGRTVHHHHVTLHGALKAAVKWGLMVRNPAASIDPPRFDKPEMHTISEEDLQRFLDAAQQTEYYPLFYTALFTGMRRSELLALRWLDVDLILCQIHITRSLHHLRTGETVFRPTKTAKSRRSVALSPSTVQILHEYKAKQENERLHAGKLLQEDDLIFPWLPDTVTHAWLKLARRVGLNGVRFHDARHTHASLLLKQNVHPAVVQQRLGHASIATTIDVYSHIMPGLQAAAANGFDDFVRSRGKEFKKETQEKFVAKSGVNS